MPCYSHVKHLTVLHVSPLHFTTVYSNRCMFVNGDKDYALFYLLNFGIKFELLYTIVVVLNEWNEFISSKLDPFVCISVPEEYILSTSARRTLVLLPGLGSPEVFLSLLWSFGFLATVLVCSPGAAHNSLRILYLLI